MRDEIQFGMTMLEHLPVVEAPGEIWVSIERELLSAPSSRGSLRPILPWRWAFAAAAMILTLVGIAYWNKSRWIETNASSRAEIRIGDIGSVEVEPNTRVRVITEKPGEHRLKLAYGEIRAKISAPPRLFFVDTKSGTAVDLGCEYALHMEEDGTGLLRVTKGWVSFQWNGLESLVPAGASCKIKSDAGPGIPSFDDAADSFTQALEDNELNSILASARVRDTLSLWHLLWRVPERERARVYDRIAALTTIPAGISRDRVLKLDPAALAKLKEELAWTW